MIPQVVIERVPTPNGAEMVLSKRGEEFTIRVGGVDLMNSRNHISEDELGRLACVLAAKVPDPRILIGGLGLGFTLRAVLDGCKAQVEVAELIPAVVRWMREHTGVLVGHPLDDPRVTVIQDDVAHVIERSAGRYNAIAIDVDNGPEGLFDKNSKLYSRNGLAAMRRALAPGGGLAVWSAFESPTFARWLRDVGFEVEVITVKAYGSRHTIWLARKLKP